VSKHLINSIGLALIAAGQSMIASAAAMPNIVEVDGLVLSGGEGIAPGFIATVELDKFGLPWDERIHASTKSKTQDGVWTKKKGVQETTMAAVVAELRQKYPDPATTTTSTSSTTSTTAAPPPPPAGPAMPQMPTIATTPYQKLCAWIAANTGEGKKIDGSTLEAIFTSNNATLAGLKDAAPEFVTQWLDSLVAYHASLG
jgi:hypothetical protein